MVLNTISKCITLLNSGENTGGNINEPLSKVILKNKK
jgi:hypothetical protein